MTAARRRPDCFRRARDLWTTMTLEGLNDDFRDVLLELADAGVEFVIVGAFAPPAPPVSRSIRVIA